MYWPRDLPVKLRTMRDRGKFELISSDHFGIIDVDCIMRAVKMIDWTAYNVSPPYDQFSLGGPYYFRQRYKCLKKELSVRFLITIPPYLLMPSVAFDRRKVKMNIGSYRWCGERRSERLKETMQKWFGLGDEKSGCLIPNVDAAGQCYNTHISNPFRSDILLAKNRHHHSTSSFCSTSWNGKEESMYACISIQTRGISFAWNSQHI